MSSFGDAVVATAKTQVGYVEGANNDNKYGAYFGMNNQPWCAFFILWCWAQNGVDGFSYGFNGGVPSWYAANNTAVDALQPGDTVCFGKNATYWYSPQQHNEIFVRYDSDPDYIWCSGGNTRLQGSQSEGEGVVEKRRRKIEVTACIHFDSGNPDDPLPPPEPVPDPGFGLQLLKPYEYYRKGVLW